MLQSLADWLFNPAGLTPHGFCLLWDPWLIWSHTFADASIGIAYFAIPIALLRIVRRRSDLLFRPVFALFAAFILLCGANHWVDMLTVWLPVYGLGAVLKIVTALVSLATAVVLWKLIPAALAFPSPAQLEEANRALRESEERRRQTQKMEALGQLAGGIAHDINNVLQAVIGGASLIERRTGDDAVRRLACLVNEAAGRGTTTMRRLLAFARRNELYAEPIHVATLLSNCREILAHALGAGIRIEVEADAGLPPLLADRGELETVLVNLATNARDAMPEGGTLTLAASVEAVEPGEEHPASLAPSNYIRLTVADTGFGMDAATLSRATEPFFTTKSVNRGTGLGLSITRGFAQQSGGALHIASRPGEGTVVTLWLPQAMEPVLASTRTPSGRNGVTALTDAVAMRPSVLLVDDEPLVRSVLAAEMEAHGFSVVEAESAEMALELIETGRVITLLVTDLSMPGMDGIKLVQEVQRRQPRTRAIVLTGYAGAGTGEAASLSLTGSFALLHKPISGAELADRAAALVASSESSEFAA